MNLRELYDEVIAGTITIEENGHRCNPFINRLKHDVEHVEKAIKEYQGLVNEGVKKTEGEHPVDPASMLDFYNIDFEVHTGHYIRSMEQYCFDCGSRMYPIYMEEDKTIRFIDANIYWKVSNASGKKYDFVASVKDVPDCKAKSLRDVRVLKTEIECPSGHLVFKNFFNDKYFYEDDDVVEYGGSDICSVLGRYDLMKNLAERNVGYGQMGNMSTHIYSNGKDEIVLGSDGCFLDNDYYYKEYPEKLKDKEKWAKETEQYRAFKKATKTMKEYGSISLSVWRWQCADVSILAKRGEEWEKENFVELHVEPGTYVIEHYYDFPENGSYLHSRIKKK